MLENIKVFCHSSIVFQKCKVVYIDPFRIKKEYHDADIILITHEHYDHYSEEDINKVRKEDTILVVTEDLKERALSNGFRKEKVIAVAPNQIYEVEGLKIETIPAYNTDKKFHPRDNHWVGYIIEINGIRYYIAGDTDITEENRKVDCDVAFVPVGGTYTMDYKQAAKLINEMKPKIVVPIHYGEIVGTRKDAEKFSELLDKDIGCQFLIDC